MSQKSDGFVGGWSDADSRPLPAANAPVPVKHCTVFCGEACDCGWRTPEEVSDAAIEATLKAGRAC